MHHSRRKSGHGSMTDVRKAASTSDSKHKSSSKQSSSSSGRRTGASSSQPSSKSSKSGSSSRDAEMARDDDYWYDDERESFPQFCMTCEKQFVAKDDSFLYCSEACRDYDQEHGASVSTQSFKDAYASSRIYYTEAQEPRDIIPRASPSRPSSTYFSLPPTPANMSSTMPATTSSAMAALRSLSLRDASPPSPTLAPSSSSIWPFSSRSSAASPSTSYTQPSAVYASTYDQGQGYYRSTGAPNYYTYGAGSSGYLAAERPLPPRRPGSYARPKSIELVTPLLGQ